MNETKRVPADRFVGCLLGGAIGDALGAPVEFLSWRQIAHTYGDRGITQLPDGAEFTDDTQMTLFTAEGLIRARVRGHDRGIFPSVVGVVHHAYLRWLHTQGVPWNRARGELHDSASEPDGWLVEQDILHRRRAPGMTCLSALDSGRAGTANHPLNDSKGCGAVMRAAPVGLLFAGEPHEAYRFGCETGALTHGHRDGYESAGALAAMIAVAVVEPDVRVAVEEGLGVARSAGAAGTVGAVESALRLAKDGPPTPDVLSDVLGEGWVGEEALAIAVCCAVAAEDLRGALIAAVNHRGDSDSTGSIAGNLLGSIHGESPLPADWVDSLEGADLVKQVASDLWTEKFEPPSSEYDYSEIADRWRERYPPN